MPTQVWIWKFKEIQQHLTNKPPYPSIINWQLWIYTVIDESSRPKQIDKNLFCALVWSSAWNLQHNVSGFDPLVSQRKGKWRSKQKTDGASVKCIAFLFATSYLCWAHRHQKKLGKHISVPPAVGLMNEREYSLIWSSEKEFPGWKIYIF